MIADLKPYPTMKDSGVPWLGNVPEHWEVLQLRNVAEMRVSNVDKHTKDDEQPVRLCNSVEVSPRLCRGTHPGLTYTAVARESPISAKGRGFTHERVPESESYEVGL